MAIQHSHESNEWGTPNCVLWRVRGLSDRSQIDFDPCSSAEFNKRVQATHYMTAQGNALTCKWPGAGLILLNPPGNAPHEENMPALFWVKLMEERARRNFDHAVWVGFTLEHLRHCQPPGYEALISFPLCIPRERLQFETPEGIVGKSPGHANVVAYVPGRINRTTEFYGLFASLGAIR